MCIFLNEICSTEISFMWKKSDICIFYVLYWYFNLMTFQISEHVALDVLIAYLNNDYVIM
jgi:hypothetical protein